MSINNKTHKKKHNYTVKRVTNTNIGFVTSIFQISKIFFWATEKCSIKVEYIGMSASHRQNSSQKVDQIF